VASNASPAGTVIRWYAFAVTVLGAVLVVVSGASGSGKTTAYRALVRFSPAAVWSSTRSASRRTPTRAGATARLRLGFQRAGRTRRRLGDLRTDRARRGARRPVGGESRRHRPSACFTATAPRDAGACSTAAVRRTTAKITSPSATGCAARRRDELPLRRSWWTPRLSATETVAVFERAYPALAYARVPPWPLLRSPEASSRLYVLSRLRRSTLDRRVESQVSLRGKDGAVARPTELSLARSP